MISVEKERNTQVKLLLLRLIQESPFFNRQESQHRNRRKRKEGYLFLIPFQSPCRSQHNVHARTEHNEFFFSFLCIYLTITFFSRSLFNKKKESCSWVARFLLNGVAASPHCLVTLCAKKIRREEKHTHTYKKKGKKGKKKTRPP